MRFLCSVIVAACLAVALSVHASGSPSGLPSVARRFIQSLPSGIPGPQQEMLVISLISAETGETNLEKLKSAYKQAVPLVAGLLQSDTSFTWDGANWLGMSRSTYSYDASDRLDTQVYQTYTTQWDNYYRTSNTYDGSGRIGTSTMQLWQTGAWVNQSYSTYSYDGSGRIAQVVNQEWTNSQWVNASRVTNTYSGTVISTSTIELWSSNAWANWSRNTYTYDGQLNNIIMLSQTWEGGAWADQNRDSSVFDVNGDEVETISQAWQAGSWANISKRDVIYNGVHQPTLITASLWIGVWLVEGYDTLKYTGDLLVEEVSVDGFTAAVSRVQRTYNGDNQEIEELSQSWDEGEQQWLNTERSVWVYSGGAVSCCVGTRGNINQQGIVDLSDLSALVLYLTGGGYVLPCPDAANINGVGIIDLSDLSALVLYLTGGGYIIPNCP